MASVGAIHQHSGFVDLRNDLTAERGQATISAMAAPRDRVIAIVGEMDLAHSEIAKQTRHGEIVFQHHGAFQIESDCELALALGPTDIGHCSGQDIFILVLA